MENKTLQYQLKLSAQKTVDYLTACLGKNGSYGKDVIDLACYYKSPMMFIAANKLTLAELMLKYIKNTFMTKHGDFLTTPFLKSENPAYIEFWSYTNGWILRAAQRLKMNDIIEPARKFLKSFSAGENKGYLTHNTSQSDGMTDVLTTAHHGLIHLESGEINLAISAGNFLCLAIEKQPATQKGFYLRFDAFFKPVIHFKEELTAFHLIDKEKPEQLYFMLAYPAAYLGLLYQKTKDKKFLQNAKHYLDFALGCHESVYHCNFSHKIGWASSIIYALTGETKYLITLERTTDYFFKIQNPNGLWFADAGVNVSFDQSAEIACWSMDINKNLNHVSSDTSY